MEIYEYQLRELLEAAAQLGAETALVKTGQLKAYLTRSEASRIYGRKQVDHWMRDKQITFRKDGDASDNWRIDRLEIAALALGLDIHRHF